MSIDNAKLEEHIQNLRNGSTLKENEVRALCEQVSKVNVTILYLCPGLCPFHLGMNGPHACTI